jgi:DeoR/GlpR family transcriptional regulator of sugar metabolism
MTLFVAERRRAILSKLKANGRVFVNDLSEEMRVSTVTIRQDLRALEREGLLERTYGGAVSKNTTTEYPSELSFDLRRTRNRAAKAAIGAAAAAMVKEGYSIALDASTTAYALIPYLRQFKKLTIVTNNLAVAQSFTNRPGIEILLPGGRFKKETMSIVGQPGALPDINLNMGFFGAGGISLRGGMSDIDPDEVLMKQTMMARCVTPVVVVDGSKWGQIAPYMVLPSGKIERIITTANAPADLVEQFREAGIQVDVIPFPKI